jgi:hypothetical protein
LYRKLLVRRSSSSRPSKRGQFEIEDRKHVPPIVILEGISIQAGSFLLTQGPGGRKVSKGWVFLKPGPFWPGSFRRVRDGWKNNWWQHVCPTRTPRPTRESSVPAEASIQNSLEITTILRLNVSRALSSRLRSLFRAHQTSRGLQVARNTRGRKIKRQIGGVVNSYTAKSMVIGSMKQPKGPEWVSERHHGSAFYR